uniref:Nuclear mitotic apparatus protein 1 n=1 Tax=Bubo bubo TaxID=30461 RepID=A0A8C0F185_BUBBB
GVAPVWWEKEFGAQGTRQRGKWGALGVYWGCWEGRQAQGQLPLGCGAWVCGESVGFSSRREEEAERLRQEVERGKADCGTERARKAELEAQLQNSLNEQRVERSVHQEELARAQELLEERQRELEELRRKNVSWGEELRDLQKTVSKLKGELASAEQESSSSQELYQEKLKETQLQKLLEAARSVQALHDGTVEALRKELQEKGRELVQSKTAAATAEKELASLRSAAQEKSRSEESWKEQVSQCVQELERKNSLIGSLEHEVSILHRQVTEKEGESKELKRLIVAESEKSKKLEERLRVLQTEMATAASRAAERCSLMKVEVQRCQEEMEKQRLTIEALKRDRHCQSEREDELRQEVKVCQDKCLQKEQLLTALQQELGSTQALAGELPLCQGLPWWQGPGGAGKPPPGGAPGGSNPATLFQVEELNKKLTQHEKAARTQQQRVKVNQKLGGELQAEATRQQEKVAELQAQLAQKEQAAEHYKGQMEKAKTHYDAKKQQNQDLAEKLKAMEQLQKENAELRAESERLAKELQQSVLQAKESELSCRNLSSQVRSLEAQVEFANRQLRELGKFQVTTDTLKGRETFRQNPSDLSTDSLDLSLDEAQPLNSTRKAGRSHSEASAVPPDAEDSLVSQQLPRKVESLESLYFTPIPSRTRSQLESSAGSLGSGAERRGLSRQTDTLCSAPEACPPPRSALPSSTWARARMNPSNWTTGTASRSCSSGTESARLGWPPLTPHFFWGTGSGWWVALGTPQSVTPQQHLPIPPHPQPSNSLGTITDEEMKTGDPKETLRRASMQPSQ